MKDSLLYFFHKLTLLRMFYKVSRKLLRCLMNMFWYFYNIKVLQFVSKY